MTSASNRLQKAEAEVKRLRLLVRRDSKLDAVIFDLLDALENAGVLWLYLDRDKHGGWKTTQHNPQSKMGVQLIRAIEAVKWTTQNSRKARR